MGREVSKQREREIEREDMGREVSKQREREIEREDVGEIVWCAVTLRGNRQRCYGVTRREQKLLM